MALHPGRFHILLAKLLPCALSHTACCSGNYEEVGSALSGELATVGTIL